VNIATKLSDKIKGNLLMVIGKKTLLFLVNGSFKNWLQIKVGEIIKQ